MDYKNKKHFCRINLGSDSMLPISDTWTGKLWRSCQKLAQLSIHHPDTVKYYRSYSVVVAERQRQLLEEGGGVIHPLSILSMCWTAFMVLLNICYMTVFPYRLFYVLEPIQSLRLHLIDKHLLALHALCLTDVFMKFNMGYIDKQFSSIVFDRTTITCNYIRGWLLVDLLSCTPLAFLCLWKGDKNTRMILIGHVLPLMRIFRICTVVSSIKMLTKLFSNSYIVHGLVRIAVLLLISVHWCACLMYLPPVVIYYWTGKMPLDYNSFLEKAEETKLDLLDFSIDVRYSQALIIVISAFFDSGFSMFHSKLPDELLIHSCIIAYAAMFMVFVLVFLVKAYLTIYDSSIRYNGLMNQVEQYMVYRQFPTALKERVRAFYEYKYQNSYYKEESCMSFLSVQLRDEVQLHTSRTLIHKVKLFEKIPASTVGTVLGCLRPEVFLTNDLVLAAGDVGDCMYFIANGTVALYSIKGVELCHLEDGAYFGEGALLLKTHKRNVTVVAVETTLLYRLGAEDFGRYIMTDPELRERVEVLAAKRMHILVLLEDSLREEREKRLSSSSQIMYPIDDFTKIE